MGQITRNCPHCHTSSVSFTSYAEVAKPNSRNYVTAFFCGSCYGGYFAEISCPTSQTGHATRGNIEANPNYRINSEYPLPTGTYAPKFLPANIDRFFLQAALSLKSGNHDASAMMSRKALEVAVKTLDPSGSGTLYNRIENLAASGKITSELKDWAHIIRDDGNEAAHEENPVTPEFSGEILSFTEMFLMYTFTMPGMVSDRRHSE